VAREVRFSYAATRRGALLPLRINGLQRVAGA